MSLHQEVKTYTIPDMNWERFLEKLTKLNLKAADLGCQPITYELIKQYTEKRKSGDDNRLITYREIEISGESPKFAGWTFVAKLEPHEGGNIIRAVPGEVVPERFREADHLCQHCGLVRTNRRLYYLIRDEDDAFMKVGSSCLKDYLGHKSPDALAFWMQIIIDLDFSDMINDEPSGQRRDWNFEINEVMAVAARIMRSTGYRKASEYSSESTADDVLWFLTAGHTREEQDAKKAFRQKYAIDDEALALASNAKAWILAKKNEETNDYWHNLLVLVQGETVSGNKIALLSSAVWGYEKEVEKREIVKREDKSNEHVGLVGEKLRLLDLVFVGHNWFTSSYNDNGSYLLRFEDAKGNCFVWFTSSVVEDKDGSLLIKGAGLSRGEAFPMTGMVKAHNEYKERKQTTLTRCSPIK